MRLLVVSNTPFLPANAGNRRRIRTMLGHLAGRGVDVALLLLPDWDVAEWDVAGMRRVLARVDVAEPPRGGSLARVGAAVRRRLDRLRPPAALGLDDWCPRWFRARVAELAREWRPDAVMVEYVFLSACLVDLPRTAGGPRTIIDTHDLMHRRADSYASAGVPLRWFHTSYADERRGLARADVVLAISPPEAAVLRAMVPERTVLTVPHAEPLAFAPETARPARLLVVASDNDLNVAGLRWLLADVWPALRAARADAELVVCGRVGEKIEALPAGVVRRGFVESLATEYADARVVLAPVAGATGLSIKVAEALCHGRPVVATTAGAAGFPSPAEAGITVADDAGAFAAGVRRLLDDEDHWRRAVAAARRAAVAFSPEAAFGPLERLLVGRPMPGVGEALGDRA